MDVFSAIANVMSVVGAASPLLRRGAVEREIHGCLNRALRSGLAEQARDDRGASASMFIQALSPEDAYDLLARKDAQLAGPDRVEKWSLALSGVIHTLDVFDERLVDVPRLARDTAALLGAEIERAARQPGSALANLLLLARTATTGADRDPTEDATHEVASSFVRTASGTLSNLASLPLSEHPVLRPEQNAVEAVLGEHDLAVLAGGPGAGKTVLSEMTACARSTGEGIDLLWLVRATTLQHRIEACEALLLEFGEKPTDDPLAQVRALLARRRGWFVVVDDAPDFETVRQLIPTEHASGAVLVTTRSAASFPRSVVVELAAADASTLREIARRRLPDAISENELDELLGVCAGNPLILATACAYLAETGTSVDTLVPLMRSAPSRVLAARPESSGFVGVIEGIRTGAHSELAWPLLVGVAVSGGSSVPRRVFETMYATDADAAFRVDEAFRELMSLGVVTVRSAVVDSHALTASVVLDLAESTLRTTAAEQVLEAVHDLVDVPSRRLLPGLAAVVDAADSLVDQRPVRVTVRNLLAERLAEQGLIHSAHRQLDAARAVPSVAGSRVAQLFIRLSEARVHLLAGESARALQIAESAVDDPVAGDDLRAAAHVVIAWAASNLGRPATAQRSIAEALRLVPDDAGVQSLHDHFFLLDAPPNQRVARYLELAESSDTELRGHFLAMASRSSILTGQTAEAVELAQRAVDADRAAGGERSLNVARDLNDLGMALVADGDLENATTALNDSIEIYREEQKSHNHAALPMLHLGRVLTQRSQKTDPPDPGLLAQARATLERAIALQSRAAPDSEDHAGMLYAYGDTFMLFGDAGDPGRALDLFREAARIDRSVFGDEHREVGLDVSRMMDAQLMLGDIEGALESFALVAKHVHGWASDDPAIVLSLLSMNGLALLLVDGRDASRGEQLRELAPRIDAILLRSEVPDEGRQMAAAVLREIRSRVG